MREGLPEEIPKSDLVQGKGIKSGDCLMFKDVPCMRVSDAIVGLSDGHCYSTIKSDSWYNTLPGACFWRGIAPCNKQT